MQCQPRSSRKTAPQNDGGVLPGGQGEWVASCKLLLYPPLLSGSSGRPLLTEAWGVLLLLRHPLQPSYVTL